MRVLPWFPGPLRFFANDHTRESYTLCNSLLICNMRNLTKTTRSLKNWVSQAPVGHAGDVFVHGDEDVGEGLDLSLEDTSAVGVLDEERSKVSRVSLLTGRGEDTGRSHIVRDRHVGEFRVVGAASGFEGLPRVERVAVHVVASRERNGVRVVPGVEERVVVTTLGDTSGVLVGQSRKVNGVIVTTSRTRSGGGNGGTGGVVGPLTVARALLEESRVLRVEAQHDKRVRKTNVKGRPGGHVLEGRVLSRLDLRDEHVTGSITHLDTLVVVDDGIVSVSRGIRQEGALRSRASNVNVADRGHTRARSGRRGHTGVDDHEILPATEGVVDLDLVEGQSGNGEGETRVLREPERQRARVVSVTTESGTGIDGGGQIGSLADHVLIAVNLAGRSAELVVKVEPEAVKLLDDKLVKGDGDVLEDVVHEEVSPPESGVVENVTRGVVEVDGGNLAAEPHVENIVSRTVDGRRHVLLAKVNDTRHAKRDGDKAEPVRALDAADEPGDSVGAAIHEPFEFTVSGEVNKEICRGHRGKADFRCVRLLRRSCYPIPRLKIFAKKNSSGYLFIQTYLRGAWSKSLNNDCVWACFQARIQS